MWPFLNNYPLQRLEQVASKEYDYIIVGGGTSGCAVASRLSENPNVKVLLLERGGLDDSWLSRIPLISVARGNDVVYQPAELGAETGNRQGHIMAAEKLGGNSRINGMIYTRSIPAYYTQWAMLGHPTWGWDDVHPYFSSVEHIQGQPASAGAVHIQRHTPSTRLYEYLEDSAQTMGLCVDANLQDPTSSGVGYFGLSLTLDQKGYRHSADRAYLPQHLVTQRKGHLDICTGVTVSSLEFSKSRDTATGVIVRQTNATQSQHDMQIVAKREIILCAGAIRSPQILQLSGIGPENVVTKFNIAARHRMEGVGKSLVDHALIPLCIHVDSRDTLHQMMQNPLQAAKHFLLFAMTGEGWMKSSIERAIFFNTADLHRETVKFSGKQRSTDDLKQESIPNAEILVVPANAKPEAYPDSAAMTLQVMLNQPFSRGSVEIQSTDPAVSPKISLNMLSDARDREVARDALRFALHLAEHFVQSSGYPYPGTRVLGVLGASPSWRDVSDEDLDEYISRNIEPAWHVTSSCRMGRRDEGGVVDDELRVHGLTNLRIADASVLPRIPCMHPMATVYMVGERCADLVKRAWDGAGGGAGSGHSAEV
ncbi:putative GMC oxidoreductase [Nemania sp. FL0916]|nr:putative GMC oxidoreductase [Nemania sp. FL0916]